MSLLLGLILGISFRSIIFTILKIIGAVILFYVVAMLVARMRTILPFLQIAMAISLIIATVQIRSDIYSSGDIPGFFSSIKVLITPCMLSVAMIFAWFGDLFFDVTVNEDKLVLTNITEKWHLLRQNEIVFHFSPEETGGFLSNFMISYVLSFLYIRYVCIPYSVVFSYLFPVVFIVMGIFDILTIFKIRLGNIVFRLTTIATLLGLFIFSVVLSTRSGRYANLNNAGEITYKLPSASSEEDFEMMSDLVDYRKYSFQLSYSVGLDSNKTKIKYRYDSVNDIGLYYKNTPYDYSSDEIYVALVTPGDNGKYNYYEYENYTFSSPINFTPCDTGVLYWESEEVNSKINSCLGLTKSIYKASEIDMNGKYLQVYYSEKTSSGLEVYNFKFYVDTQYNVIGLYTISYTRQVGSTVVDSLFLYTSDNIDYSNLLNEYTGGSSGTPIINTTDEQVRDYFAKYGLDQYDYLYTIGSYDMLRKKDFVMTIENDDETNYIIRDSNSECQVEYDSKEDFNISFENNDYTTIAPNRITRNYMEYFDYVNDDQPFGTYYSRTYALNGNKYSFTERAKNEYGLENDIYSIIRTMFISLERAYSWSHDDQMVTVNFKGMRMGSIEYTTQISNYIRSKNGAYEIYQFDCKINYNNKNYYFTAFVDDKVSIDLSNYKLQN